MRDKKIRGLNRKTRNLVNRLVQETNKFPSDFYNRYWHLHLPVAKDFISSSKTPFGIRKLCIKTLLSRAETLIKINPIISKKLV
ncbi:DUF3916 domain-containing protein [Neobacillus terrae]|uniref:DUF3916 domain-containing protein n=1 Tax=Neobacillus terrae TaxID=3034837 RepID=UPI003082A863